MPILVVLARPVIVLPVPIVRVVWISTRPSSGISPSCCSGTSSSRGLPLPIALLALPLASIALPLTRALDAQLSRVKRDVVLLDGWWSVWVLRVCIWVV
jgi:hypothetical protein